jgi:hypothetical protein
LYGRGLEGLQLMRKSLGTTRSKAIRLWCGAKERGVDWRPPSRLSLTGDLASSSPRRLRGAVGRPRCGPNADGRLMEGSRIGEAAAASVPCAAAARCRRPTTGIGACGEPSLRWAQAGGRVAVCRAPRTGRFPSRGWCLTRKCSRQAGWGRRSVWARRSSRPNNGSVGLCGR